MPGRRLIRRSGSGSKKNTKPYNPENEEKLLKLLNHIRRKFNNTNIYNAITPANNARKLNTNTTKTGKNGKTWIVQFAPNSKVVKVIYPKMSSSASLPKMWVLKNNNNKASATKKYIKKVKNISKLNVSAVNSKNRNLRMKLNSTLHNHAVSKGSKSSDIIKSFFRKKYAKK